MTRSTTAIGRFRTLPSRLLALGALVTVALAGASVAAPAAPAAAEEPWVWEVQGTSDEGMPESCTKPWIMAPSEDTLRDTICAVNNNNFASAVIVLPAGDYELDPANGPLEIGVFSGTSIELRGPDDRSARITGGGIMPVMRLDQFSAGGISVTLRGLSIGKGIGNVDGGAGILAGSGYGIAGDTLEIINSEVVGNRANVGSTATNKPGGGVQFVGGSLSIIDSTISGNDSGTSGGGGVSYTATGVPGESFTVRNSVFEGNTARSTGTAAIGGGAIEFTGGTGGVSVPASISDSVFAGNTVTGSAESAARGGAILQNSGALELRRNRFVDNTIAGGAPGAGAAVHASAAGLSAAHNIFYGNAGDNAHAVFAGEGAVAAENNWWGCNLEQADAQDCDTASDGVDAEPSLMLRVTQANEMLPAGATGTGVRASLLQNSAGEEVAPADLTAFDGEQVTFTGTLPNGTTSAFAGSLSDGHTVVEHATAGHEGRASVTAELHGASVVAMYALTPQDQGGPDSSAGPGAPAGPSGSLSHTGFDPTLLTVLALIALVLGGAGALIARARRRKG